MSTTLGKKQAYDGMSAYKQQASAVVLFRTHFWDDFVDRQFARLLRHTNSLDVIVLVDETKGPVFLPEGVKKFGVTDHDILEAGFVAAGGGSIQWFSGDVPLYLYRLANPGYDFYIQLEYDVVVNTSLTDLALSVI